MRYGTRKDSFITQERHERFEGGLDEASFSSDYCGLTISTITKHKSAKC